VHISFLFHALAAHCTGYVMAELNALLMVCWLAQYAAHSGCLIA
jgi:uncharacterized membrane protein YGL010W